MHHLFGIIPIPQPLQSRSLVYDLKARLDWGKPALTILDVRDRVLFNASHIVGAISMPADELIDRALASLPLNRDLYVYGETDEDTALIASQLRTVGYRHVSEIRGGVSAWKAVGFPIETVLTAA
ncbi:rhodanese-like domain-containing protein [Phormidium sp. FACHB-592]|uniref:Rhodanese-like domain-containing protein n=2 Tax=Leptolyngbyaceae TaxID=1890438 RepID=A0ABV0KKZ4_9CYAN|nr:MULTISPECIES: rhodanese-like domain-containing protein [Cyanophyceae]MBD2034212.1 rhodanese-like domain-containing protein [Leptolyngbya sp. FACHB-321]MBD2075384.1 rhodanese-like domain-containing protein [Phormidium sp. FACHB-592]